jgi:hypothetical protein
MIGMSGLPLVMEVREHHSGPFTLGARGDVLSQYITNTLQGNGQRT